MTSVLKDRIIVRWACLGSLLSSAACAGANQPPSVRLRTPDTVEIVLGDEKTLTDLYSYTPGTTSLANTIEHYLAQSLGRDGLAGASARVSTSGTTYRATLTGGGAQVGVYAAKLPGFLKNGQLAETATLTLKSQGQWKPEWQMFLPLGLALTNPRSVQLLHFPPTDSLTKQDYLDSATTRRWERLLTMNGVADGEKARYETIVDIAPVAAPANAGNALPIDPYLPYAKAQLELLVGSTGSDRHTQPVIAYGCPVRQWVKKVYQVSLGDEQHSGKGAAANDSGSSCPDSLPVLTTTYVNVMQGKQTPVIAANHPSAIWYTDKMPATVAMMIQDLTAACWQVAMAATPDKPLQSVVDQCKQYWSARPSDVCVAVEMQVCNQNEQTANSLCAADPTNPPPCPPKPTNARDKALPPTAHTDSPSAAAGDGFPPDARPAIEAIRRNGGFLSAEDSRALAATLHVGPDELMIRLLPLASRFAVPAISSFYVGAIARGLPDPATGWANLYLGGNVEFTGEALSFVVHAEQAAVNNAWLHGERGLSALAISAAPCGYCRQYLYEIHSGELPVLLRQGDDASGFVRTSLRDLLPRAFGPRDLKQKGALMDTPPARHQLELVHPTKDALVREALAAAEQSYAPYTKGYAGCAIEAEDGTHYVGRYAENAAYNPSLEPLASAIANMRIRRAVEAPLRVRRAVLVEVPGRAGLRRASAAVLASVAPGKKLEVAEARIVRIGGKETR